MPIPISRRSAALGLLASSLGAALRAGAQSAPPRGVVETLHGVAVPDPYRNFENTRDPAVQDWLRQQGERARAALDRIEGRDAVQRRIAAISAAAGDSVASIVRMPGQRTFYLKRGRRDKQYKLVLREGEPGRERVLFDPQAEAERTGVAHAINHFAPSWDGAHVAFGLSAGGSEDSSLHILQVATGKRIGQPIPRVREANVSWLPGSRSLTYNQLKPHTIEDAATETFMDSRVMWLQLGDDESRARPVFGPTVTTGLGLGRLDVGGILFAPGSRWMIARTTDTTQREGSLFLARVAELASEPVPWQRIAGFDDQIVEIELQGDWLYYRTRQNAPRYRIMGLDLRQPELARAREIAVAPQDGVIEDFVLTRGGLVAAVRQGTSIGLRRYRAGDARGRAIAMPYPGAARLAADPAHAHPDLLYTLSGWTRPAQVLRLRGGRSVDAGVAAAGRPLLPAVVVTECKVRSHDGALVPMTVLHRRGLALDGRNPTLLHGYGAYGLSETAAFRPAGLCWIEQGGVLAFANVRGSGVYGESWRRAGFKATKANTWKDGIACAQYLIEQGYASSAMLAVAGGSAGGIFAGRCITTAPQLFAAAILNVGVMDAVRAEESANGVTNISEFGSARNPAEFPALLEMSTYHQIRDGTPYPAVLLVHGLNDPRVDVWHSAKAAARLLAATTSGKPVLLRLDAQAGHGVGSTATQRHALAADIHSFLLWQMGRMKSVR